MVRFFSNVQILNYIGDTNSLMSSSNLDSVLLLKIHTHIPGRTYFATEIPYIYKGKLSTEL